MQHAGAVAHGVARLPESPETVAVDGAAVGAQHHVGRTQAVGVDVVEGRLSEAGGRLAQRHDDPRCEGQSMLGVAIDAGAVAGHPVALVGPLVAGVADHGARLHALGVALSVGAIAELRGQRADGGQLSGIYGQLVDGGPRLPLSCQNKT